MYSLGLGIWVLSTSFWKSNIGWPQQPPSESVPHINEKLDFWWSIPQKMTSIGHFSPIDDQTKRIRISFEEIGLQKLLRPFILKFWKKNFLTESWKLMLNFSTFSVRSCWGQPMLLFKKLIDETLMPMPQKFTDTIILTKKLFLVGLRGFQNISNPVKRPCTKKYLFLCFKYKINYSDEFL